MENCLSLGLGLGLCLCLNLGLGMGASLALGVGMGVTLGLGLVVSLGSSLSQSLCRSLSLGPDDADNAFCSTKVERYRNYTSSGQSDQNSKRISVDMRRAKTIYVRVADRVLSLKIACRSTGAERECLEIVRSTHTDRPSAQEK